ncbi:MAG: XRE family transcriptional regulator [Candidatus Omnitrophota bacterium]
MDIGERIHKIRKEQNMTLSTLSEKSGVALATLSRIENGKMTGTLESHIKICEVLGVPLPELYSDLTAERKQPELQTKEGRADIFVYDKRTTSEMLTTKVLDKKMMPILIKLEPQGATHNEETKRGTEKFIFVLAGKIRVVVGEAAYELKRGDTLYFDSSIPHNLKNTGVVEAQLICVTSPPTL